MEIDWEAVACAYECPINDLPKPLIEFIELLHKTIKGANGMSMRPSEEYGLRSTQIIGLVVLMYKMGLIR